jgi:hypothetical protein
MELIFFPHFSCFEVKFLLYLGECYYKSFYSLPVFFQYGYFSVLTSMKLAIFFGFADLMHQHYKGNSFTY